MNSRGLVPFPKANPSFVLRERKVVRYGHEHWYIGNTGHREERSIQKSTLEIKDVKVIRLPELQNHTRLLWKKNERGIILPDRTFT